jgi:eukaryotic-like serine/threonine-protein kinase
MAEPRMQPESGGAAVADLTGTTVGRFLIRARLGAGGMGEVYRADDTRLKRTVALKRIAPDMQADERYRRYLRKEAELASGLSDPHIAAVHDLFEEKGQLFLVMEYVEGQTLRQKLSEALPIAESLGIARQCAEAVAAAHARGILHRDLKPENIVVNPAGQVKILDFGVAKRLPRADEFATLDTLATQPAGLSGTPPYMAPEVLQEKEADTRADIFSLGVICYEMLSGKNPFRAPSFVETCDRILHKQPTPLHDTDARIPEELDRVVGKAMVKDPTDRYASAADLAVDLRAIERAVAHPGALPILRLHFPRQRTLFWSGAALVALLALATALPSVRLQIRNWLFASVVPEQKQIAVLAFTVTGNDSENAAFGAGLTETLTTKLTQLTGGRPLQVVPATEVKARGVSTPEQALKEFGVNLALEGSFLRADDRVRVNFALVDTRTRRQLRADSITVSADDPFAVQDAVVGGAVQMLDLKVKPQERQALEAHGTQVPDAYSLYLQGRGYLRDYDRPENVDHAVAAFQKALALDPKYALADTGLGQAYWWKYAETNYTDATWVEPARQACERALQLDPKLAPAHICLGKVDNGTGKYEQAVSEFQEVLRAEATSDEAYRGLADAYQRLGRLPEAEQTFRRAIELRPQYWAGYSWLGDFYFRRARYGEAAQMFAHVVELAPDSYRGYSNLGAIYVQMGRYEDARQTLEHSIAIRPSGGALINLGAADFYLRRYPDAAHSYEQATKLLPQFPTVWGNLGEAYYWSPGQRAQAAGAFQKAVSLADEQLRVNPREPRVLGQMAWYHAMLGQRKDARGDLSKALQIAPDNPDLQFKAALVHCHLGEAQAALEWLKKAHSAGVPSSEARNNPFFDCLQNDPEFQKLIQEK